jgi:hypothetical protein
MKNKQSMSPIQQMSENQDKAYETQCRDEQSQKQTDHRKPVNVTILGDSMLKYINLHSCAKAPKLTNTHIERFPGTKVDDMKFYVNQPWPVLLII